MIEKSAYELDLIAVQMDRQRAYERALDRISFERSNYRARTGRDAKYVVLGRMEYIALRSSPYLESKLESQKDFVHGLEVVEATRIMSFVAVCESDTEQTNNAAS